MMALAVPAPNDKKRVKVYELRDNDWFDRGTGFCTGQVVNVRPSSIDRRSKQFYRACCVPPRKHAHRGQLTDIVSLQDEPRIFVESEDEPQRMLLETRISKDDGYQKQQGPLEGSDLFPRDD